MRTILDKLIYFDKIQEIDQNMSDSQIGARKNRNIRNHLFMIYGVQNELKQSKNKSVDIVFYDVGKMFDSQWTTDTMNDIYDVCDEKDDKVSLMYKSNMESYVAINTPFGKTKRKQINNIEMQGSVLGPIKASAHMDTIGKTALEDTDNLFMYKNMVGIPPIEMIDDVASIEECGVNSVLPNSKVNCKIEMKKLPLNKKKCKKLHMGKNNSICPDLKVHGVTIESDIKEKYLGDQVASDCSNKENIEMRKSKGLGIVSQILSILDTMCLGGYYFESAVRLRNSILANGILFNSEVWYDLKETEIRILEQIDETLLRKLLSAHSKTPLEALYLELGCLPLRFIIKARRINYLHYLVNLKDDELLAKFFDAQLKFPVKGDWISTVKDDLNDLDMDIDVNKLKHISKEAFKKEVQNKITKAAFKYLMDKAKSHSKMMSLKYEELSLQNYLKSRTMSKFEAQKLFRFRTYMEDFRENLKNGNENLWFCPLCLN